jgi:hypothetical protein
MYRTNKILNRNVWKQIEYLYGKNHQNREKINELNKHEQKVTSQHGEDGVLHNIFIRIGTSNKYFVEFGAADGKWLSNTHYLRTQKGWTGLLLEADLPKEDPTINLRKAMVTPHNINQLFEHYHVPQSFDLLSIDIDGNDFWVWNALINFRPRVVIVETNASPNKKHCDDNYFGANLRAFYRLAKKKGYEFITTVKLNAIFVLKEDYEKLGLPHVTEDEAVQKYFKPDIYWYKHRDKRNRVWVNPFAKKKFRSKPWMIDLTIPIPASVQLSMSEKSTQLASKHEHNSHSP